MSNNQNAQDSAGRFRAVDRREFLRLAAGGTLAAAGLTGCGGGSGNGGGGGGGGTDSRLAVIAGVELKCTELTAAGVEGADFNAAVLAHMQTVTAFEATGINEETSCIWGRFTDGSNLVVTNNRAPGPGAGRVTLPGPSARSGALPATLNVRLMHTFGPGWQNQVHINEAKGWLSSFGYQDVSPPEGDARLSRLRGISGDAVFYLNSHGGACDGPTGNQIYGLWSSTVVNEANGNIPEIKDDVNAGRLLFMTSRDSATTYSTHYAITPEFVDKYMSFGKNSVVFINACNAGSTTGTAPASAMIFAFHKKGAGVYLGFNGFISDSAFNQFLYFIDRLLGANEKDPESPDQRAFEVDKIMQSMVSKGLDREPTTGSRLKAFPNGTVDQPELLAPSIKYMDVVEEFDQLILTGSFGITQGEVRINGTPMSIISWDKGEIRARLDSTGANSIGEVFVYSLNIKRRSNSRWISEWKPKFTIYQEGNGDQQWEGPLNIRIRADAASYRENPGEAPRYRDAIPFTANRETTGRWNASGRYNYPKSALWQDWKESADLVNADFNPDAENTITCFGVIKPGVGKMRLALAAESNEGMRVVTNFDDGGVLVGTTGLLHGPFSPVDNTPCLDLDLNEKLGIRGDIHPETHAGHSLITSWLEANPSPPINDSAPRSVPVTRSRR